MHYWRWILLAAVSGILSAFFPVRPAQALTYPTPPAQPMYLIVHQVRGQECCGYGTVDKLRQELQLLEEQNLSGYFALRYDALKDPFFVDELKKAIDRRPVQIKPALLLEITPALASASGVIYQGNPENWHRAAQAYTIGYHPKDRQKLVDTAVAAYQKAFGTNPQLTSAWMIDTESLNYLHDRYRVKIHQMTREQWGLDSYTLYGGQFHYPYRASRSWLFMADPSQIKSPMIVRQTVMDPLWVYGDTTSAFTSQPNDYVLDGKTFEYFQKLISQQWQTPSHPPFIVLGLENTMTDEVHQEYVRQLTWVGKVVKDKHMIAASPEGIAWQYGRPTVRVVSGKDLTEDNFDVETWWVSTPKYRVRILRSGSQLSITDIRLYDLNVADPYASRSAQANGYWVAPFILDTSLTETKPSRQWWQFWKPPDVMLEKISPKSDVERTEEGWSLPELKPGSDVRFDQMNADPTLTYSAKDGREVKLIFSPEKWVSQGLPLTELEKHFPESSSLLPVSFERTGNTAQIAWKTNDQIAWQLLIKESEANKIEFMPLINSQLWPDTVEQNQTYFFPEPKRVNEVSSDHTVAYINNPHTVAGRTPIRIVMAPKNDQGESVGLNQAVVVESADQQISISDREKVKDETLQFIDISRSQPGEAKVELKIGENFSKKMMMYFTPDCRVDKKYCLQHPVQAWWFIKSWFADKIRSVTQQ